MAIRKAFLLCRVQLIDLLHRMSLYINLCLLFIFFYYLNSAAVRLQAEAGLQINSFGYTVCAFSNHFTTLIFGFGCVLLFSNLPLLKPNSLLEIVRCTRQSWLLSRFIYILFASIGYVACMLFFCNMTCHGDLSSFDKWGKILNAYARSMDFGFDELPIELNLYITTKYSPIEAFLLLFFIAVLSVLSMGSLMFCLSLLFNKAISIIFACIFALLDFAIYERLPYFLYKFSPFSFTRLTIICNPDMPYYPSIPEAIFTCSGIVILSLIISSLLVCRGNRLSSMMQNEMN